MSRKARKLQSIDSFEELLTYLHDELDWPTEQFEFDDLTFKYDPEELGLDANAAAQIGSIRQLRPLIDGQPWGIFFIEFERKNLPVVALRRVLSALSLKKRPSANAAEHAAWNPDDLLFISRFEADRHRQISFAHFERNEERGDLPTLKVLGWDDRDTRLHMEEVVRQLGDKLAWPDDSVDVEGWRESWQSAFTASHRQVVRNSQTMAARLAELAGSIRDRIKSALDVETDKGPLTRLMNAFRSSLVGDLDADGFADMYAQTIAYGLLSSRIADPSRKTADDFAAHMRTSPFLRELMQHFLHVGGRKGKAGGPGIDFDELGVSDVVTLLDNTDMEAVVRDFGDRNRQEDPVIHFYEHFLAAYNKRLKVQRGVFYTPQPVVSYIVRSVHELLQTEFGLEDGLADITTWGEMLEKHPDLKLPPLTDEPDEQRTISPDEPFVQILDPATGTATFLVEVIEVIHRTLLTKWKREGLNDEQQLESWNNYVPQHLLPRLHAYELMMAPYAIAHMKIGLKLAETGYRFGTEERARIYLTNALEPWQKQLQLPELKALAHEATAVNEIKRYKRFTAVIGNPPYAGHSSNKGHWALQLVKPYYFVEGKPLGERNPKWLQDDYVKFIALGQKYISQTGCGIQSYITNHGYIDNPTFRGMRQQLTRTSDAISILDLHGNYTKKERSPDGSEDHNVFDIKQGVAIFAAVLRNPKIGAPASINHAHLFGSRDSKYSFLSTHTLVTTELASAVPDSPFHLFIPQDLELRDEYDMYFPVTNVMPVNVLGFQTHRDKFAVDFDKEALRKRIERFRDHGMTDRQVADLYGISDTLDWNVKDARKQLRDFTDWERSLISCSYRPFDLRTCYFSTVAMDRPRRELQDHVADKENLCLGLGRQGNAVQDPTWNLITVSKVPVDANIFRRGGINVFPLWLYPGSEGLSFSKERRTNFGPAFLQELGAALALENSEADGLPIGLTPEDIFHYTYAVFHSLGYRSRYAEFLKIDFPRLPLTGSLKLFHSLARLGGELVALHLLESPSLDQPITEFIGTHRQVTKVGWTEDGGGTVWLDGKGTKANFQPGTSGFRPVPEEVWKFHIGGYQVCEKWLKDRGPKKGNPGRTLTDDDIAHYHQIVIALTETIRLMPEIDEVIKKQGGWPDAFASGEDAEHRDYSMRRAADEPETDYGE